MKKVMGPVNALYPMPVVLVGIRSGDRDNFLTIGHVGILSSQGLVSICVGQPHFSNVGIRTKKAFSINIPSRDLVKEVDYCGMASGTHVDKSKLFTVSSGSVKSVPLIDECPVSMECELVQSLRYTSHEVYIAQIVETHVDPQVLNDGQVDLRKVRPILFDMNTRSYWKLGPMFAPAWKIGKNIMD